MFIVILHCEYMCIYTIVVTLSCKPANVLKQIRQIRNTCVYVLHLRAYTQTNAHAHTEGVPVYIPRVFLYYIHKLSDASNIIIGR